MKLKLIPHTEEEREQFLELSNQDYIASLMKAFDFDRTKAEADAKLSFDRAFTPKEGIENVFLSIVMEEQNTVIGGLWLSLNHVKAKAYLYQIILYKEYRGKGNGKKAMSLLDTYCKKKGMKAIGLNVFGFNTIARGLYGDIGYEVVQSMMRKEL